MTKKRYKSYPGLSREQKKLVEEHSWIAGRLAFGAKCLTGGNTGSLTREDLESIANFALCVAATRFDPDKHVKFSTYAWKNARGYIQHALRDYSRLVKTPRWIAKYRNEVLGLLQENMSYTDIAKKLNIDEARVLECQLSENNYHISYDSQPEDWVDTDFVYSPDEARTLLLSDDLAEAFSVLSDEEMDLMVDYISDAVMREDQHHWASEKFQSLKQIAHGLPKATN